MSRVSRTSELVACRLRLPRTEHGASSKNADHRGWGSTTSDTQMKISVYEDPVFPWQNFATLLN